MPNLTTNPAGTAPATVRAQLVTNAVIAAYIHEISVNDRAHHNPASART